MARLYVADAVADDVVQETWITAIQGIERFEGRSSLKTWILRILVNRARTRGEREQRTIPFSSYLEPSVEPQRFEPDGGWESPPSEWPEERLLAKETLEELQRAIAKLPPRQQEVIVLRDVEGWEPDEVSAALDLSDGNQRVLLHRARSKVRAELERYFQEVAA
jgi:RNA polymerase sigma-70 factor (ECF subfamily)